MIPIETESGQAVALAEELRPRLASRAAAADLTGRLPVADLDDLRRSGYLALTVPRRLNGGGATLRDVVAAQMVLAQGSTATALVAGMQLHLLGYLYETGSYGEGRLAAFGRAVVAEGALFNAVASEPILGSPSRGGLFATTAVPYGPGYRINGHKNWVTGGPHLTHMLVKLSLAGQPATVLVTGDLPGIRWEETWSDSLSLRASESNDLFLENVDVPAENLLATDSAPAPPNFWFPLIMAGTYLGAALAARDAVIRYALQRVPPALGRPISTLPKIQRQIGEMDVALQAAELLLLETCALWRGDQAEAGRFAPHMAAAKHLAIETALASTETALRIAGGISVGRDLPLERHFRDVRAGLMHPPSGDAALEMAGRGAIERLADTASS